MGQTCRNNEHGRLPWRLHGCAGEYLCRRRIWRHGIHWWLQRRGDQYDTNGVAQWTQSSTGTNGALAWAGPPVDAGGNCYIAGWFKTNVVFGNNTLTGKGYWDFFLAKIGTNAVVSNNAPVITLQPPSQTNAVGSTANFNVSATGNAPLVYQWRKNGTNLNNNGTFVSPIEMSPRC